MRTYSGPKGPFIPPAVSRRSFVQGLAAGGVAASLWPWSARVMAASGEPQTLTATDLDLTVADLPVNFTGRPARATAINGSVPGPLLRWREGDEVRIRVTNRLAAPTSVHWHGLLVPAAMDGAPGFSFAGIDPGGTFEYRFRLRQSGTYWYHSHSGLQEQTGHYGPLVILPRDPRAIGAERDHVVVLSDWTDEDPVAVLRKLKKQADYYNREPRTVGDFLREARAGGWRQAAAESLAWGRMRMNRTDLADVSGVTYTYLMNGVTPAGNWTALYGRGERVRLRFINAG
ncbi:MAG: multicopper oxidase domain-containing protein, partial [Gammaproteobacteria bacterium]|nr:multicopper oxidase domain-containing protein [Gammaproteobacteria bacterium]